MVPYSDTEELFRSQFAGLDTMRLDGKEPGVSEATPSPPCAALTALVDPETYAFDLYMALPVKAIAKPLDRAAQVAAEVAAAKPVSTQMGAMSSDPVVVVKRKVETAPEQNGEKRESYE